MGKIYGFNTICKIDTKVSFFINKINIKNKKEKF